MPKSELHSGFIVPPSHTELIVADHCNLSCRACNHASPVVGKWYANPDTVHRDFSVLAKHYRPKRVKVLGGEPILHPELAEVIRAARSTGVSDYFILVTNGALMDRMDDEVLELIDEMEISVFAGVPRIDEMLSLAREKTRCSDVKLSVNEYDMFRATFTSIGTDDQELVGKIYDSCKVAHVWGAHSVRDGYLYRCPQSIYIRELVRNENGFEADRIPIEDSKGFQTQLLDFVNASVPLASCTYCVGTVGRQQPHKFIQRDQWKLDTEQPSESLIDYDWLERSLIKQDRFDDCKIPTEADLALDAHQTSWWRQLIGTLARRRDPEPTRRRLATPVRQAAAEAKRELEESVGRTKDA